MAFLQEIILNLKTYCYVPVINGNARKHAVLLSRQSTVRYAVNHLHAVFIRRIGPDMGILSILR